MTSTELEYVPDPWDRLEDETQQAYFAFVEYCKLGPSRTLRRLSTHLGISYDSVKMYSRSHKWVDRTKAYDGACNELVPSEDSLSPTETLAFQYAVGKAMLELGIKAINLKKPSSIKVSDAIKLIDRGADMQRKAQGLDTPGVNININSNSVDAVNELISMIEGEIIEEDESTKNEHI